MKAAEQPAEKTVFIVDDDPDLRDALAMLMRSAGLQTEQFSSAREFLQRVDAGRLGCLVLDIRMPGMSGLELQQRLAATASPWPIIFISGHGDAEMATRALAAGAVAFLRKPFRDQALLDAVESAVAASESRLMQDCALTDTD